MNKENLDDNCYKQLKLFVDHLGKYQGKDTITNILAVTIVQFLHNVREDIVNLTGNTVNDAQVSINELIYLQINQLRKCVIDLEACLKQGTLQ